MSMVMGNGCGRKLGRIPPSGLPGTCCSGTLCDTSNEIAPQPAAATATATATASALATTSAFVIPGFSARALRCQPYVGAPAAFGREIAHQLERARRRARILAARRRLHRRRGVARQEERHAIGPALLLGVPLGGGAR